LIELMVALTLGLVIVGGVLSIFVTNQQAFRTTAALGRVQENSRIAFELMARDFRQSGGNACGTPLVKNLLNSTTWSNDWDAGAIVGYTGTFDIPAIKAFGTSSADRVAGTDAVKVLGSAIGSASSIGKHNLSATASTIALTAATPIGSSPNIVVACDGTSAVIVQVDNVLIDSITKIETLSFNVTGNCSTDFSYTTDCPPSSPPPAPTRELKSDGFVAPLSASFWYIGYNSRDGKSLYRTSANATEEIAENVVDMRIAYLMRTEATRMLDTNWVDADGKVNPVDPVVAIDWKNDAVKKVVAIRFTLKLETLDKVGTNQQAITRDLIHVVNLRNRSDQ
jgi:type IV pilus assembly protein PilW